MISRFSLSLSLSLLPTPSPSHIKRDKITQDMEEIIVYIWWSVCLCVNRRISEIVNTGNVDGDVR